MNRIVVGLDGSPRAPGVLVTAIAIAELRGAHLILLRAVGLPVEVPQDFWRSTERPLVDVLVGHAQEYIDAQAALVPASVRVHATVRVGVAWEAICVTAQNEEAELVVIGSHGYSGMDRLIGTTAARVVNNAHCSVLVSRGLAPASRTVARGASST